MKTLYKFLFLALALTLTACQPDDAKMDYGFPMVYIPQATVTGLDNSYPIPLGAFYQNSVYTCAYDKQSGKLNVVLGVIRSGYLSNQQAFSVDLGVCKSETDRKLAEYDGKGTPAAELPASVCSIPSKISVEAGNNGGTCYVAIDMKALASQQSSLYVEGKYKLLVLGLEISNLSGPAEYKLADNYTSVVLVLDLNSEHWDSVAENKPESAIRSLFPIY